MKKIKLLLLINLFLQGVMQASSHTSSQKTFVLNTVLRLSDAEQGPVYLQDSNNPCHSNVKAVFEYYIDRNKIADFALTTDNELVVYRREDMRHSVRGLFDVSCKTCEWWSDDVMKNQSQKLQEFPLDSLCTEHEFNNMTQSIRDELIKICKKEE